MGMGLLLVEVGEGAALGVRGVEKSWVVDAADVEGEGGGALVVVEVEGEEVE